MQRKNLKIVSLFSGIGGFEVGLKNSKLNHTIVFASEIDKHAQKSYIQNFGDENLFGDITKIDESKIPDHDMLCAGFPCQAFSIAGQRLGFEDIRGTLFFDVARILKEKQPKYVLLENVKNLLSHDKSKTIKVILNTLNDLGYIVDFTLINSNEVGLPQNRDRTYIIGVLNGKIQNYEVDKRSKKVSELKKELNLSGFKGFNFFNSMIGTNHHRVIADILQNEVDEKFYFNSDKIQNYINSIDINIEKSNSNKIIKILDLPKEVHNDLERQRRVYSIYGISPTILARSDSTKVLIEKDNKFLIRKFTPYENFLAQGFEESFINKLVEANISDAQMYKQSGNAVSPPVIEQIANHIQQKLINKEEKKMDNEEFTFIDLFCGLGGFRIALEKFGCKCLFSSDIDKYVQETYEMNFGEKPHGDLTKINAKDIPDHDILCAGFPCQPFSLAGKRLGFEDTRGTLFFDIVRIVEEKQPKAMILENVAGIVNHDNGKTLSVIENNLEQLGYQLYWKLMNAYDYGIPQNRNRWYGIAIRKDLIKKQGHEIIDFLFPLKKELEYTVKDIIKTNVGEEYSITKTAKENINTFLESFKQTKRYNNNHILLANEIRKSRCNFRCDGISPCLTAKMGTGGNNVPVVVNEYRKLTESECLEIMGYPQWYRVKKNNMQTYKQIGNSVVVPVIELLAENLIEYLK